MGGIKKLNDNKKKAIVKTTKQIFTALLAGVLSIIVIIAINWILLLLIYLWVSLLNLH